MFLNIKAKKEDVWFHIKDVSGSHVVVFSNGKKISNTAIFKALTVAAYYSDAHDENKADVLYNSILNAKKLKFLNLLGFCYNVNVNLKN